jgi:REP element-mobilizing transposase RayT
MSRCIDGLALFADDDDRVYFLRLLSMYVQQTNCRCYAWSLMPNHYHLVLRTGEHDLWRTMKPLNTRYAQYHSRKCGRRGPLFTDRYKSIVTQDQNYVQELVRYVHLNPVRAGLCKSLTALDSYHWTGHAALMGRRVNDFQDLDAVLRGFGKDREVSQREYRKFLAQGLETVDGDHLVKLVRESNASREKGRGHDCWVIGDPDFVKKVLKESVAQRLRVRRSGAEAADLNAVAETICRRLGVPQDSLTVRHRGGPESEGRKAFAFVCVRNRGIATRQVADFLRVSPGAVSNMLRSGQVIAEERKLLSV